MAKSKAKTAAEADAGRTRTARFVSARYGVIVVTFRRDSIGIDGSAEFERFPGVTVTVDRYGIFTSPNGVNVFQVRFPASASGPPATRNTAALDVMEPHATCTAEVK